MKVTGTGPMMSNHKRGQGSSWTVLPEEEEKEEEEDREVEEEEQEVKELKYYLTQIPVTRITSPVNLLMKTKYICVPRCIHPESHLPRLNKANTVLFCT
jgi:hypothetical protein